MKRNSVTFVYFPNSETFECHCFLDDLDTTISFTVSKEEMKRTLHRLPNEALELLLGPELVAMLKGKVS